MRPILEVKSETLRKFADVFKALTEEGKIRVIVDGPSSLGFNVSDEAEDLIKKGLGAEYENYEGVFKEILTVADAVLTGRKNAFKEYIVESEKANEEEREKTRNELEEKFGIITEALRGSRVEKETTVKSKALLPVFAGIGWETKQATAKSGIKKYESIKSAIITISTLENFENPLSYIAGSGDSIMFEVTLYDVEEILEELRKIENKLKE